MPGLARDTTLLVEQRIELVAHRQPEAELDRSPGDADGRDVAALHAHPLGNFLEIADGRRQPDELDVARGLDDDLFPDGATWKIVDVVDLVEDDVAHPLQPLRVFINKVAQDLGGHHHHWRQRVDGVLARDQPDIAVAVQAAVIPVLLVR